MIVIVAVMVAAAVAGVLVGAALALSLNIRRVTGPGGPRWTWSLPGWLREGARHSMGLHWGSGNRDRLGPGP